MKIFDIDSRRELFVDRHLIERMSGGAALRLQAPVPREAVLHLDRPWERGGYITVFRDADLYRMYYMGHSLRDIDDPGLLRCGDDDLLVCYAESRDGISWRCPSLGLFAFKGSTDNNIVWSGRGSHGFAPFIDMRPGCPAAERYKALGRSRITDPQTGEKWRSLFLLSSPDGLHWTPVDGPKRFGAVMDRDAGHYDSQNVAFWDALKGEYRLYYRWRRPVAAREDLVGRDDGEGGRSRQAEIRDTAVAVSDDLLHWRDWRLLEYPGAPLQEMYTNQVRPYERAPHIYIGFPSRYVENRGPLTAWHRRAMCDRPGRYFQSYTDGLIMSSRDGCNFFRWNEAFLRPGMPEDSRWGYGECYQSWGMIGTAPDVPGAPEELSFFVTEGRRHADHANTGRVSKCIRRFTLRQDGFVALNAPFSGGELLTRPLRFKGQRLFLNFCSSAAGGVRVEIQHASGQPAPGFALEDCRELFGNNLERAVEWNSGADLNSLAGQPVRLRFVLHDADIFAYNFNGL